VAVKVHGIEGMTHAEVQQAIQDGGRFVMFQYCFSVIVMTFRRSTGVYFVPAHKSVLVSALPWIGLSLVAGWWGIPWGPIYTIGTTVKNLGGGTDVTEHFIG
jgi:hypothetical protein